MKDNKGREQEMVEIKGRWKNVTEKEKWAARGASLVAKAKATKVVWFPPKPVESGRKGAATAKKATKRATTKATSGTKKVTNPVRRKRT